MSFVRYFLILVAGLSILLFLMYFNANTIRHWLNPDTLTVSSTHDIDKQAIEVLWTAEGQHDTLVIFKEGLTKDINYKAMGNNLFLVHYQNEVVAQFEIFKSEVWNGHDYQIEVGRDSAMLVVVNVNISGPDAYR